MPKTTAPEKTPEQLEAEAAELAARLSAIQEQQEQRRQAEARRLAEAEQAWDEQAAAGFDRNALDAEVARAEQQFRDALADVPLVRAMADLLTARQRRRTAIYDHQQTLSRLGRETRWNAGSVQEYPEATLGTVQDYVVTTVQRLVTEHPDAEYLDRDRQREQFIADRTATD